MTRGRKKRENYTLEEKMKIVDNQISEIEVTLKELKSKKKELEAKIIEEQKEKLYNAVLQSGKTIDEIIAGLYREEDI